MPASPADYLRVRSGCSTGSFGTLHALTAAQGRADRGRLHRQVYGDPLSTQRETCWGNVNPTARAHLRRGQAVR
ncbi:hypothetical protein K7G98_00420 [Saccharothrix sp. MB29]|nr:hypothetical protein [Saccharothrix sp. MB29]